MPSPTTVLFARLNRKVWFSQLVSRSMLLSSIWLALPIAAPKFIFLPNFQGYWQATAQILPGDRPGINVIRNLSVTATATGTDISLDLEKDDPAKFVTISRGSSLIIEISNTRIQLIGGKSVHQNNPAPGIASITLLPLDQNTSQIIVTGSNGILTGEVKPTGKRLVLKVATARPIAAPALNAPPGKSSPAQNPGTNIANSIPRAIAPPLGDIATTSLNITSNQLKLGTTERIPSLVLRSAPVRDVLSLLAMTAGLNSVFLEAAEPIDPNNRNNQSNPNSEKEEGETNISLEIKDEAIENVFNYILQISKLQAKLDGKTILIGRNLPPSARDFIVKTVRLNQLKVTQPESLITTTTSSDATLGSGGSGATSSVTNSKISRTTAVSQKIPVKGALQILEELGANGGIQLLNPPPPGRPRGVKPSEQIFNGIQVSADTRTNSVTLIGAPNLVKLAEDYLKQLDVRKRQVSVNVRIIEVELDRNENIGASFSFGVNDSFFVVNGGAASANFGATNPSFIPSNANVAPNPGSLFSPDIVQNPLNPGGGDGITRAFQFPSKFLLNLQARVVSNDAKILTDPTLIVQEGSSSQVNLTTQVFAGFRTINQPGPGNTVVTVSDTRDPIDVGVILNINVEQIDDNGFITLAVSPEVSSPGQSITDPSRNNLLIQQLVNRRRLDTGNLRLRDGQTLILAGIINETERTIATKTPFLGDIPLIGALFRGTSNENKRNEVIVLVTPKIID